MSAIELLKSFQMTESEAKVYLTLIENGPKNGYEISKISGVPRSKVYNILESLEQRGIVCFAKGQRTKLYKAEPIEVVCSQMEQKVLETSKQLRDEVHSITTKQEEEQIWELQDWKMIRIHMLEMIQEATRQVLIQIWSSELDQTMEKALQNAQEHLDEVLVILYDPDHCYRTNLKGVYRHGYEQEKISDMHGRWLLLTVDGERMLYVSFDARNTVHAIYTQRKEMSFFAREYIMHDAYCLKILNQVENTPLMEQMSDIRNVFQRK